MSLLSRLQGGTVDSREQPLILVGHDRGARICHHLSVHNDAGARFPIRGTVLLDIVPTLVQFQTFSSPAASMVSNFVKVTFFKRSDHGFAVGCYEHYVQVYKYATTNCRLFPQRAPSIGHSSPLRT